MHAEVHGKLTPAMTRHERRVLETLGQQLMHTLQRRLPMTLELESFQVEVRRSDLAAELVDQVARRREAGSKDAA